MNTLLPQAGDHAVTCGHVDRFNLHLVHWLRTPPMEIDQEGGGTVVLHWFAMCPRCCANGDAVIDFASGCSGIFLGEDVIGRVAPERVLGAALLAEQG